MNISTWRAVTVAAGLLAAAGSARADLVCNAGAPLPVSVPGPGSRLDVEFAPDGFRVVPALQFPTVFAAAGFFQYAYNAGPDSDALGFSDQSMAGAPYVCEGGSYQVLVRGTTIGPASHFGNSFSGCSGMSLWRAGATGGYVGVRFLHYTENALKYGWIQLDTTGPLGIPAVVRSYCYQDDGSALQAGMLPAAPEAPVIGTATAGEGSASVAFTAPANNGGMHISGYVATATPGGLRSTGCTESPCTISGLTNGTSYTFTVTATNAVGTSPESAPSNPVVPARVLRVPEAPQIGEVTAGDGSASVAFTPPANDGGSPITGYVATSDPGGKKSSGCTASPCTVRGLTNGTVYTFTVTATNAIGTSPASDPSFPVVAGGPPRDVPGAPRILDIVAGDRQATLTFEPPESDGGSPITKYVARDSGASVNATCAASPCVVRGLTNGEGYRFVLAAVNAVGTGPDSEERSVFLPAGGSGGGPTRPSVPAMGTATAGDGSATVSFGPPDDDGGSPVTGYTVTSDPEGRTSTGCRKSPCTVTGLKNGTTYVFTVTATNAIGTSDPSPESNEVTPGKGTTSGGDGTGGSEPPASSGGCSTAMIPPELSVLSVALLAVRRRRRG